MRTAPRLAVIFLCLSLAGCAGMMSSATGKLADNLSKAVLNQNDLQTVHDGAPAFLLMIDGLIEGDPDNTKLLFSGSRLYAAYASAFVNDDQRAKRLTDKSLKYANRGLCQHSKSICESIHKPFKDYEPTLAKLQASDVAPVYAYSTAWASWLSKHADDWNAVADLPKLRITLERLLLLDYEHDHGGIHLILGVLESQLPPSLGGKPDKARKYFETADQLSGGNNLMIKLLFARHYARLVFDQKLHDKLLNKVITAKAEHPGFTLMNTIAQQRARKLLASSKEYF